MIYIDLLNHPPNNKIIEEGKRLTEELKALPDSKKAKFIKEHQDFWGGLKNYYSSLSHGKCWYTEVKEKGSPYHMDHFRPKNSLNELKSKAPCKTINRSKPYWWLAFDWTNYRLSASNPNTRKHTYFPLKEDSDLIEDEGDIRLECIGLLDPIKKEDVALLTFDDRGHACAACSDDESWDARRVALSVRVYGLNDQSFVDARVAIRKNCKKLMERITGNYSKDAKKHAFEDLKALVQPDVELSGVAIDYIRQYKKIHLA